MITRSVLNLRSRSGTDIETPVIPGEAMQVDIPLVAIGWSVPVGHGLRLALSATYWPWIWPHPEIAKLDVDLTDSELGVPVRAVDAPGVPLEFAPPEQSTPLAVVPGAPQPVRPEREVRYEPASGRWTLTVDPRYGGDRSYPDGLDYREQAVESYSIVDGDPLSATATSSWRIGLSGPGWQVHLEVDATMTADATHFVTEHRVQARCDGASVFDRTWHNRIPRTSC